jgi:hypothetical protein
MSVLRILQQLLLPQTCIYCRRATFTGKPGLCDDCRSSLQATPPDYDAIYHSQSLLDAATPVHIAYYYDAILQSVFAAVKYQHMRLWVSISDNYWRKKWRSACPASPFSFLFHCTEKSSFSAVIIRPNSSPVACKRTTADG